MLIRPAIGDTDPIRYRRPTPDGQFSGNILDEAMRGQICKPIDTGNPPHRYQTCAKADSTRTHHRMVLLAQSSPGCRSTRPLQIKKATVMLGIASPPFFFWFLSGRF